MPHKKFRKVAVAALPPPPGSEPGWKNFLEFWEQQNSESKNSKSISTEVSVDMLFEFGRQLIAYGHAESTTIQYVNYAELRLRDNVELRLENEIHTQWRLKSLHQRLKEEYKKNGTQDRKKAPIWNMVNGFSVLSPSSKCVVAVACSLGVRPCALASLQFISVVNRPKSPKEAAWRLKVLTDKVGAGREILLVCECDNGGRYCPIHGSASTTNATGIGLPIHPKVLLASLNSLAAGWTQKPTGYTSRRTMLMAITVQALRLYKTLAGWKKQNPGSIERLAKQVGWTGVDTSMLAEYTKDKKFYLSWEPTMFSALSRYIFEGVLPK